ncbi:YcxB family protein [Inquilinus sp.]|uniref:YcxB family protein n=1 Tax=Inquilinus sp. TaxID=1932117 RepID=UPI003784B8C7
MERRAAAAARRRPRRLGRAPAQLPDGPLAGLIAVILGDVDTAAGRLVVVLGFLAVWSVHWALVLAGTMVTRREGRQTMDWLRRERRIAIDEDGFATTSLAGTSRWFWSGVEAVSEDSGLILVGIEHGLLAIPRRAVAEPEALLALLRQRLAAKARSSDPALVSHPGQA